MKGYLQNNINRFFSGKIFILVSVLFLFVVFVFQSQSYYFKPNVKIPFEFENELNKLGQKSIETMDVPVASILVYKGKIIGRGYNTVKRESNIGGHAEINAMSDAYKTYGDSLSRLNRNELVLYSTFEPCEMCKGAIVHYNIKKNYFEKNKSLMSQLISFAKSFLFEIRKNRFDSPGLQDSLFDKYPGYKRED